MEAKSKTLEAYEALKNSFLNEVFAPGQKLIYRDLELKLGMSRTPITNALSMLEQDGFVILHLNRGYYVRQNTAKDWNEIFEIRIWLEESALGFVINRYNNEDLKLLKQKLNEYIKYDSPIYNKKRVILDTEFHLQIIKMAKNDHLTHMISRFYDKVYFTLNTNLLMPSIERFKIEHQMLYNAIKAKDIVKAKKIIRTHLGGAKQLAIEQLKS